MTGAPVTSAPAGVLQFRARPLTFPSAASAPDFCAFETWIRSLPAAERGPAWEAFTEAYLCQTPALDVQDVWRPADPYLPDVVLEKLGLARRDVGQDFVVRTRSGSLWIVQAKFRSRGELTWEDVKGAVAAGRNADRVLFVSNAFTLGGNCPPALLNQHVGAVLRHDLIELGRDFFDHWEATRAGKAMRTKVTQGRREQQIAAIASVIAEFGGGASRTQLIAACGTGKTRMGLWVMEDLSAERVLFFAPSLALVSQSVGEWTTHAATPIDVVCVCSDNTAGDMSAYELAVPVTTRVAELRARWEAPLEPGRRRVVFSTYHSAPVVRDALRDSKVAPPELMVCDEAHRIAGDEDKSWQLVLDEEAIPARRRLFMTATPKLVSDELKAAGVGASMDDESFFGRVAHCITFRDAINAGMLADYRIHVIGVPTSERRVRDMVRRRKFVLDADGTVFTPTLNGRKRPFDASEVAQALALEQALEKGLFQYAFTFHSRKEHARRFLQLLKLLWRPDIVRETAFEMVTGDLPVRERRALLERALALPKAVVGSVQALSEGVDVPAVDAVVFADPKESVIAIVQAIGRALRKRPNAATKTASIVIPVPVPAGEDAEHVMNDSAWATVWNVVAAMSQHDGQLAEHLQELKRALGSRRVPGRKTNSARAYVTDHLSIELPDGKAFELLRQAVEIAVVDRGAWAFWHMLALFRAWVEQHPYTAVPPTHVNRHGERLGEWVARMRAQYAAGELAEAHREALVGTRGWFWTEDDERWGLGFERAREYVQSVGSVPLTTFLDYNDPGLENARWLDAERKMLGAGKQRPERVEQLRSLAGWYEDEEAAEFDAIMRIAEAGFDSGTRVGGKVTAYLREKRKLHARGKLASARAERIERLPGWSWTPKQDRDAAMLLAAEAYEGDFAALAAAAPKTLAPNERELRAWCNEQRRARRAGVLPLDVETRLGKLLGWEWDPGLREFERRVEMLRPLMAEHYKGWLPLAFVADDGTQLGRWVADQRALYRAHRLSEEKSAAIESVAGWDWAKGEPFARNLRHLRAYARETNGKPMPESHRARSGDAVGQWASRMRQSYRSIRIADAEQVRLLEAIPGWDWEQLTDNQERMLRLLSEYMAANSGALPPKGFEAADGVKLGVWAAAQVSATEKGTISPWLLRRLDKIPEWRALRGNTRACDSAIRSAAADNSTGGPASTAVTTP